MKTKVIVNPAAGRGACGKRWPEIETHLRAAFGPPDVAFTRHAGDEAALAREALEQGAVHFVAVGGDGTANGVLAGIQQGNGLANPELVLSPVPAGTANELARELGVHGSLEAAVQAAAGGRARRIDLLRANCAGLRGDPVMHHGFLAISWGSAAEISYRTSASRFLKKLGGQFSYYAVTLIVTLTYQNFRGRLQIDDRVFEDLLQYTGMICNTEYLGGGMRVAPGADAGDGTADLLLFRDIARKDILLQKPSWLFEGHHVEHDKVDLMQGRRFSVQGPAYALVDADGETIGRLPLQVELLPGALTVRYG